MSERTSEVIKEGICRGCGKKIGWVRMLSGKRMPVDLEPVQKVVVIYHDPQGVLPSMGKTVSGYTSHFATCPQADKFRKGGESGGRKP